MKMEEHQVYLTHLLILVSFDSSNIFKINVNSNLQKNKNNNSISRLLVAVFL